MKSMKILFGILFTLLMTMSLGMAATQTFHARLSGKEAVPAVKTKAKGEATFKLSKDGKDLTYTLTVKDIDNVTLAHIHAGKKGENGGPVATLFGGPKKEGKTNGMLAKGTITDKDLGGVLAGKTIGDLVTMIKDGGAYVNVHTDKNPGGEIRGQIK